jgi:hypothetical protein
VAAGEFWAAVSPLSPRLRSIHEHFSLSATSPRVCKYSKIVPPVTARRPFARSRRASSASTTRRLSSHCFGADRKLRIDFASPRSDAAPVITSEIEWQRRERQNVRAAVEAAARRIYELAERSSSLPQ